MLESQPDVFTYNSVLSKAKVAQEGRPLKSSSRWAQSSSTRSAKATASSPPSLDQPRSIGLSLQHLRVNIGCCKLLQGPDKPQCLRVQLPRCELRAARVPNRKFDVRIDLGHCSAIRVNLAFAIPRNSSSRLTQRRHASGCAGGFQDAQSACSHAGRLAPSVQ